MASSRYRLASVRGSACTTEGEIVNIDFKGFCFDDDTAVWELRRIVVPMVENFKKKLDLHRIIKSQRVGWQAHCTLLGVNLDDVLFPSFRAASHSDQADLEDERVQDEWTVTTVGLVGVLLFWAEHRRLKTQRARAAAMLRSATVADAAVR